MSETQTYAARIRGLKPTYGHGPDVFRDTHERGYYAARNDAALIGDEADAEIERLKDEVTRLRGRASTPCRISRALSASADWFKDNLPYIVVVVIFVLVIGYSAFRERQ
jgi:hypothetical protein